jgi:voltage-gated potassium channel
VTQDRRHRLHEIIFEADTAAGKTFDVILLLAIVASVIAVMLESVTSIQARYGAQLRTLEWGFTVLFTLEYGARLYSVRRPLRYARSFFGVVDLLAIVPTYLSLVVAGSQSLIVIRALRLLRVFRVLKLMHFVGEASILQTALRASSRKILVFLSTVATLVIIIGTTMYMVEGSASGFTSIPISIYWAVVTLTTVGYGDIAPATVLGRFLASLVMVTGYAIIAVPTGIVTVELAQAVRSGVSTQACPSCGWGAHDLDARHCKRCGAAL